MRHTWVRWVPAFLLTLVMVSGCLFDTRDPDPPTEDGNQIIFDDPEDVFRGMSVGLEEDAFSNYERAISDDYVFSPLLDDSLDQTFGPDTFKDWTRDVEREVMRLVLSESDTLEVDFSPSREIDQSNFVRFKTTYSIRVVLLADGSSTTYEGVAMIDVRNNGGLWQVTFWDEVEPVDGRPSWGFLRGIYRQILGGG